MLIRFANIFDLLLSAFRFANSLPMNDPLQTLYQLMSERQPAAVTVSLTIYR